MTEQDWREQVRGLLESAESLEPGEHKVMTLEEAARLADAHGDIVRGFDIRDALIDAATFGGFPDKALVAFAWCRSQQQRDPVRLGNSMLWKQKWVVGRLTDFPHIGRAHIERAIDDFEQCCEKEGRGRRSVSKLRYKAARDMGDTSRTEALWTRWLETPRDTLTDCRACELHDELDHPLDQGDHARAMERAKALLEGRVSCAEVPHLTLGRVLYALFTLGRLEQARASHLQGYSLVRNNREFLGTVGEHLEFLALTGNVDPGLRLLERHVGWALTHASHRYRFTFHTAALALLDQVLAGGRERVALALPRALPLEATDGTYDTRALRGWFEAQAEGIARTFDARNGTERYRQLLARARRLRDEVRPFPIEGPASD